METRRSAGNTRRRILNELGQMQGGEPLIHAHASSPAHQNGNISVANGSLNASIQDEAGMITNNMSNILNGSGFERKSSAEEELIRIRGRKKRKSAPNLRDLSPASLATIKSPMKQPTNEDIAYFLRLVNQIFIWWCFVKLNFQSRKLIQLCTFNFHVHLKLCSNKIFHFMCVYVCMCV